MKIHFNGMRFKLFFFFLALCTFWRIEIVLQRRDISQLLSEISLAMVSACRTATIESEDGDRFNVEKKDCIQSIFRFGKSFSFFRYSLCEHYTRPYKKNSKRTETCIHTERHVFHEWGTIKMTETCTVHLANIRWPMESKWNIKPLMAIVTSPRSTAKQKIPYNIKQHTFTVLFPLMVAFILLPLCFPFLFLFAVAQHRTVRTEIPIYSSNDSKEAEN